MVLRSALVALACVLVPAVDARAQQCPSWRTGFGDPTLSGPAYASIVYDRSDGPRLFVGGGFTQAGHVYGSYSAAWGPTYGWSEASDSFNGAVRAYAIYDTGAGPQLYVGGDFTTGPHSPNWNRIVRGNGYVFSAVGTGVNGPVHALAVFDDGSGEALYAGGLFTSASGVPVSNVARWNGTAWSAVGGGTNGLVRALVVFDDGTGHALYAGGDFLEAGGAPAQRVARWNGTTWSPCGAGVDGSVRILKSHRVAGHEIMAAGGDFTNAGNAPANRVAHWDGTAWSPFGAGFDGPVHVMIKHDSGGGDVLYAGGAFTASGTTATGPVARWGGSSWIAAGENIAGTVSTLTSYASSPTETRRLFAAGNFGLTPSTPGSLNFAVLDEGAWRAPGQGIDGEISDLLVHDEGSGPALFAGGHFPNAGGTRANHVARWDGEGWTALGSGVSLGAGGWASVAALLSHDDGSGVALYAGGDFDMAGGIGALGIARWDGASWSAVGGGVDGAIYALATFDDGTGPALYAAGTFNTAGGVPCSRVARWNGTSWSNVGTGVTWWVGGLASFDDGTGPALYACGIGVERWNGSTWSPVGTPGDSQDNLAVIDDGTGPALYVSGGSGLKRWNGSTWVSLYSSAVAAIGAFDDGTGNGTALYMSTWDVILKRVGGTWVLAGYVNFPYGSTIPGQAMAVYDDGSGLGPDLFVGGRWGLIGPTPTPVTPMSGIAALKGCGATGRLFCFGDGTSTACPCGNASSPGTRVGCLSSLGIGGAIRARGVASIGDDTLVLDGTQMSNSSALYVQGATLVNGGAGVTFGDGLKCTGGPFVRLATKTNVGGASSYPVANDLPLSVRGHVLTPGLRRYQVRYRNSAPFCTPDTFNYTNGVEILWSL